MRLTPNDIEVLIHCHCHPEPHPRLNAPAVSDAIQRFLRQGLIETVEDSNNTWATTERGRVLIDMLCETPLPEQRWFDPRTEAK